MSTASAALRPSAVVEPAVRRRRLLPRPRVEVGHHRRPVVLRDERDERLGQARLVGDVDALGDVALEQLRRRLGVEHVVDVVAARLVLDERDRVRELADVVVVGRDAGEQRVARRSPPPRAPRGCRPSALWWYVPGVSTSSRRRSGCDGLASSSSWNAVRIPNREPSTANEPTVATAAPPAETAAAPNSSTTPRMSWSPSSPNVAMTSALTTNTANPAWTNTAEPVAAPDARRCPRSRPAARTRRARRPRWCRRRSWPPRS